VSRPSVRDLEAIFQRSPILISRLLPVVMPDDTPERIVEMAHEILDSLDERDRIATLDAHPRIGDPVSALSSLSATEQGAAADAATERELADLNAGYERKFGFRFVVFVRGRSKREIVPVFRARLARTRELELEAGIDDFLAISLDRLRSMERASEDDMPRAMDVDS
jgi:2-oxo-4-hydroxy-4-carboxy--5-ureidoimidazoline (OHCU) decarboxylase